VARHEFPVVQSSPFFRCGIFQDNPLRERTRSNAQRDNRKLMTRHWMGLIFLSFSGTASPTLVLDTELP